MTTKAELRQATLISEAKSVPGTGTVTSVVVSAPITGGGAGPVVPVGATLHDATHSGFLAAGPIGVVDGGTGADLSGLAAGQLVAFDGTKFAGVGVSYDSLNAITRFTTTGTWEVTIGNPQSEAGVSFVGLLDGTGDEPQFRVGGLFNYVDFFPAIVAPRSVNTLAFAVSSFANFVSLTEAGFFPDAAGSNAIDLGVDDSAEITPVYGRLAWRNGYFGGNVSSGSFSVADLNTAPSSASDTGTKGEIRWVADFVYLCIDTDTWVRAALATWV